MTETNALCPATFLFNYYKQVNKILTNMPQAITALKLGKTPKEHQGKTTGLLGTKMATELG